MRNNMKTHGTQGDRLLYWRIRILSRCVGERAQRMIMLAAKPASPSLIPGMHAVEGEPYLLHVALWPLYMHSEHGHATYIQCTNKYSFLNLTFKNIKQLNGCLCISVCFLYFFFDPFFFFCLSAYCIIFWCACLNLIFLDAC